ncbi:hypothetical protein HX057_08135 [Myroides odoratimimus]|uniref:Uncharacterized protein n=1 Tax=Myroides odoratimimus CIP 101113 TaxID=883154 RepID=A0AAV3F074_9FLAO|nr:hypothetical protein [Myroides odoratimimus]EHO08046.1 hypothetical protein HMPREF9715_02676 [Myroides odoratimimus CIP 101113]EKB05341.1 hypothetical protein HMPREF9711_01303 [Myroides odoratimimus CCUG 3837]EPH14090.1 hypothetical protein HMPREF9713_00290 [Myroides odoratimimus CCUG 12700]MCA4793540.1 hypothetical protein [Myroides odoratimimus]MCA4820717.1 hypothetical protein [Myroides odoratimimus]
MRKEQQPPKNKWVTLKSILSDVFKIKYITPPFRSYTSKIFNNYRKEDLEINMSFKY